MNDINLDYYLGKDSRLDETSCLCVCVCVCEMTKEMAGSTRHLPTKQNTLLPSVATNFGFIIQSQ